MNKLSTIVNIAIAGTVLFCTTSLYAGHLPIPQPKQNCAKQLNSQFQKSSYASVWINKRKPVLKGNGKSQQNSKQKEQRYRTQK